MEDYEQLRAIIGVPQNPGNVIPIFAVDPRNHNIIGQIRTFQHLATGWINY